MRKPFAYISAAWPKDEWTRMKQATDYSRTVYDAGYYPICPLLSVDLFTNDGIPEEHRDRKEFSEELLHRSRILVVCGEGVNASVKNDIALAKRWKIAATSIAGIEDINWQKYCD